MYKLHRCFPGEGDHHDMVWARLTAAYPIGDTASQDAGLSGAGAGHDADGLTLGGHSTALRFGEIVEEWIGHPDDDTKGV